MVTRTVLVLGAVLWCVALLAEFWPAHVTVAGRSHTCWPAVVPLPVDPPLAKTDRDVWFVCQAEPEVELVVVPGVLGTILLGAGLVLRHLRTKELAALPPPPLVH